MIRVIAKPSIFYMVKNKLHFYKRKKEENISIFGDCLPFWFISLKQSFISSMSPKHNAKKIIAFFFD